MPFRQSFEDHVNRNMQDDTDNSEHFEEIKVKQRPDTKAALSTEEEDHELSEKKDRPPRFSTLFTQPPPPPQIVERYIEPPRQQKKKGIYIPLPLFIILAIILFFETTLLFAYTIIALDNNLGRGLFPFVGGTRTNTCPEQQAINVAPKFYMGSAQSGPVLPDKAPSPSTTTATETETTTSISVSTQKPTAFGKTQTTEVVVVTPTPTIPSSTLLLTVDENGSTLTPSTSTKTVAAKETGKAKKRASVRSKFDSIVSEMSSDGEKEAPTPTTLVTAKTKTNTEEAETTSEAVGGGACFGGAGAVGLVCPDGVGRNTKV